MIFIKNINWIFFLLILASSTSCGDEEVPTPSNIIKPILDELPDSKRVSLGAIITNCDALDDKIQKYGFVVSQTAFEGM